MAKMQVSFQNRPGGNPTQVDADHIVVEQRLVVLVKQPGRADNPVEQFAVPPANLYSIRRVSE